MQIDHLSTALPKTEYTTDKLIEQFPCPLPDEVVQNILNLGVTRRCLIRQSNQETKIEKLMDENGLIDLCVQACQKTLVKGRLRPKDVNYLITAYDANPFLSPGLSQLLLPRLKLSPFIRHVNAQGIASTAFTKTLELARDYLAFHPEHKVLVCISGVTSYWFQNQVLGLKNVIGIGKINSIAAGKRKQTELRKWVATMEFFLFGDGVAAAIVSNKSEGMKVNDMVEVTNVDERNYLAGYARLSLTNEPFKFGFYSHLGKEIPELGAKYTGLAISKLFDKHAENGKSNIKKWAVHTGSRKILDTLAKHHGATKEQIMESHEILKEKGNLAGASLPFILERILSRNRFATGDTVLMLGYGWGFSASAGLLEFCS